ncbi:MAG: PAS domain S-box protein [Mariniphaga sp.]
MQIPLKGGSLRQKAEDLLKLKVQRILDLPRSEAELLSLIHELEVSNLELQIQNDDFIASHMADLRISDQFRKIASSLPGVIYQFLLRPDGTNCFPFASEALFDIFHLRPIDILTDGSPLFAKIHLDDILLVNDSILKSAKNLSPWQQQFRVKDANEASRFLYSNALPERMADGSVLWHGFTTDITDQKSIESRLLESDKCYKHLISNLHIGVLIQGPQSEIRFSNSKALELLGFTEDQLLGKRSLDSDWNVIHEDGAPYPGATHPVPLCIATRQPVRNAVMGVFHPLTRRRVWLLVDAIPQLTSDGSLKDVICTFMDITDRKLMEENLLANERQYHDMFHRNTSVKLIIDPVSGAILKANEAASLFYGYTIGQIESMNISEINLLSNELVAQEMASAVIQNRSYFNFRHRLATGEIRDVEVYSGPLESGDKVLLYSIIHDVTSRNQAEYLQKVTLDRLQKIASRVPGVIYEYRLRADGSSCFPYASEAIRDIYRVNPEEVLYDATKVYEKIHPDDLAIVVASIQKSANDLTPWKQEYRVKFDDGTIRTLYGNAIPQRINDGSILWHGFISDISDRKLVENELAQSRSFLNSIIEHSPNALTISDHKGTLLRMNKACRDILNLRDEEVIGRYNILEDNLIDEQGFRPLVNDVFENGKTVHFTMDYDTSKVKNLELHQTKRLVLDINISPILDSEGKVKNVIVQHNDISKLKRVEAELILSESRFRAILENSYDAIGVHVNGMWEVCNPAALKLFDVTSPTELLGKSILNVISPNERERIADYVKSRFAESTAPFSYVTVGLRSDGSLFDMDVRLFTFILENKRHVMVILRDISNRLKTQKALQERDAEIKSQNEQLILVNAEKDKFFSIIAHDLKGPFSGFLGLSEILTKELPVMSIKEIHEIVRMLNKSAHSLYNLIENLLEWSRMQRGMIVYNPHLIRLKELLSECLISSIEMAQTKEIGISVEIPERLIVFSDWYMINSVIRNLVNNAIKFTPEGGNIKVSAKSEGTNRIAVSIHDSGIGMNKQMIADLFRLDINTSRKGTKGESSTGLGLIICRDFIEKHGGNLSVESEEGKGSTFRFTLPVGAD